MTDALPPDSPRARMCPDCRHPHLPMPEPWATHDGTLTVPKCGWPEGAASCSSPTAGSSPRRAGRRGVTRRLGPAAVALALAAGLLAGPSTHAGDPAPRPPSNGAGMPGTAHSPSGGGASKSAAAGAPLSPAPRRRRLGGHTQPPAATLAPRPARAASVPVPPTPPAVRTARPPAGVRGVATWYAWRPGQAAAGPRLRAALGPGWRGRTVYVFTGRRCIPKVNCVRVRLTDWMRADRLIDLDSRSFAFLAPLSRGVLRVTVSW